MMTIYDCYKIKTGNFKATLRSSVSVSKQVKYLCEVYHHVSQLVFRIWTTHTSNSLNVIPWTHSCWTSVKKKPVYIFLTKIVWISNENFSFLNFIILSFWNFCKMSMFFLQTDDTAEINLPQTQKTSRCVL